MDGHKGKSSLGLEMAAESARDGSNHPARAADCGGLPYRAERLARLAEAHWDGGLGGDELLQAGAGVRGPSFPGPRRRGVDRVAKGPAPVNSPAGPIVAPGPTHGGVSMERGAHRNPGGN